MLRVSWLLAASLCACASAAPGPAPLPPPRKAPSLVASTFDGVQSAQYRLIPARTGAARVPGALEDGQRVVAGRRVIDRGGTLELAETSGAPDLTDGRELPGYAGAGFVFWSRAGLYRSRTFTGRLDPVGSLPFSVNQAAFGPGYVLLRDNDGSSRVLDLASGKLRAPQPVGLLDVAASADGRLVMALELGRYAVSLDRGGTLREVQDELGQNVQSLSVEPLGFVLESGALVALSPKGELLDRGVQPRVKPTLLWPAGESALEQTVAFGVLRGSRALVAQSAAVAEVDVQTGKVTSTGPQLLPAAPDCKLHEPAGELVMACQGKDSLAILGNLEGERPNIEQTFERSAVIVQAFGYFLVDRECSGGSKALTVCVRERGGTWRSLSAPEKPAAAGTGGAAPAPAPMPRTVGYGFKADGNVVAFVRGTKDGYVELRSGQLVELDGSLPLSGSDQGSCRVERDGTVRCLSSDGPRWFGVDRKLRPSALDFSWVGSAGERALGVDQQGKLFQSEDWGISWVPVALPPHLEQRIDRSGRCSAVGCRFGGWLRIGWDAKPPEAPRAPVAVPLPSLATAQTPVLACAALSEPKLRLSPQRGEESRGFGLELARRDQIAMAIDTTAPSQGQLGAAGMRGVVTAARPKDSSEENPNFWTTRPTLTLSFVDFFEPAPRKQRATLGLVDWFHAQRLVGASVGSFSFDDAQSFQVVPVLSPDAGKAAGFILTLEQTPVWVSAGRATPLALERENGSELVLSAVLEKSGALVLLLDDGSVIRYGQGASVPLFHVPPNVGSARATELADVLGVSAQGEVAVLRFTGGSDAPSAAHPLLAYRPNQSPEALAPFSSVTASSDAKCSSATGGYRALVTAGPGLLRLERGPTELDEDWGMTAALRWSAERACLEAVEMADAIFEVDELHASTRVVATFGAKPNAARLAFASGQELQQALRCELRR